MKRVLVTRPRDESEALAIRLKALGFETVIEPMIEIRPLPEAKVDWLGVQAVAFTSANGVRALTTVATTLPRDLPVFAVGRATATAARQAGFRAVIEGPGTVEELATLVADRCSRSKGKIIHVSGSVVARDFAGLLAASNLTVERTIVYESAPAARLDRQTCDKFANDTIDIALFFSPRTARTFVNLMVGAGLAAKTVSVVALALSPAVAEALAPLTFANKIVASRPTTEALLDALVGLKH